LIHKKVSITKKKDSLKKDPFYHISLFDYINQIAYVSDPYTNEVLYVNKFFKKLLGENPIGKKCYEAFQNFTEPCSFCTNKIILKNKGKPYEWEYHNPVLNKDYFITDRIIKWHNNREVRFEFAIDITELKQIKKQISDQAKLVNQISDAVIATDSEFKITSWNKAAEEIYGFTQKQALGKQMHHLVNVIYREDNRRKVLNQFLKNGFWKGETIQQRKDGKLLCIYSSVSCIKDTDGNFVGSVAVNSDITEKKRIEEKIKESEERYELAQRAAGIGSWDWNISTGELIWSDKIEVMFGFRKGHFNKTYDAFIECIHPDDRQLVIDSVDECLKNNKEYDIDHRIVWPDGSIHWVRETGDVIRNKSKKPIRMVGIVQDITHKKETEEKIKKLNEDLFRYSLELTAINKELEAFSYSVSHDLRAPLRSIDGFGEALLEEYSDKLDDVGRDYLHRVRNATQKMGRIIDDLLKLSRITRSPVNHDLVNLTDLSQSIVNELQSNDSKRKVTIHIEKNLTAVADKDLMYIALENLIGNAWKFTSKKQHAIIKIGKTTNKNKTVFFIRDNGAGFDMKYAKKLFVPFQRLHSDSEFPGIGIGLGIVNRVIHRHGGEIWAKGKKDQGATFYFTLREAQNE
jgi:PAS domain S-box-containing protein